MASLPGAGPVLIHPCPMARLADRAMLPRNPNCEYQQLYSFEEVWSHSDKQQRFMLSGTVSRNNSINRKLGVDTTLPPPKDKATGAVSTEQKQVDT